MQSVNLKITGQWKRWFMPLIFCVLLTGLGAAAELGAESGVLRSRVCTFKHISSQQAQEFFTQLGIGKKYNVLTPEILIVTSDVGSDLVKATAVAGVLDQTPLPKIETLKTDNQSLPKPDAFMAGLESITVGTLAEAPTKGSVNPAIIDVVDNRLVAIASESILNDIKAAFQKWEKENQVSTPETAPVIPLAQKAVEPNLPPLVPEPNEMVPPAAEAAVRSESLESIVRQLLEAEDASEPELPPAEPAVEPSEPEGQAIKDSAEDFLSEGLLNELADAGQKVELEQEPEETSVPEKTETVQPEQTESQPVAVDANEPETNEDAMAILQALMAQARAEEEQALAAEKAAAQEAVEEKTETPSSETEKMQTAAASPAMDSLKSELTLLRQKIAELEARTAETKEPAEDAKIQTNEEAPVAAKPTFEPDKAEAELEIVKMDLPEEVELESLVDMVGKQLGLNYLYEQNLLKNQKVQLKVFGQKIKVTEIYSMLELVLRQKGFVMTRHGQVVTIVKATDANQVIQKGDIPIVEPGDPFPPGAVVVGTKFTLANIATASAKNMLGQMGLGMANGIKEIPETGTLIVMDYTYRMEQIRQVLEMIDVPGEKKEYEFRTLKYMTPSEIVPKLQDLVGKLEDVSLQISTSAAPEVAPQTRTVTTRNPQTGQIETRQIPIPSATSPTSAASPQAQGDTILIDTDDRTNRILMAGKPGQIALINELIDALDVPQYDLRFVREYLIQNVEAQDVVDVINQLGLASVSVETSTTSSGRTAPTVPVRPGQPVQSQPTTSAAQRAAQGGGSDQPYISVRAASNSLLVNATAEQHKAIELVIAYVDVVQKDQRTIKQYEIQYVDTQEIINTLTDLGIIAPQTTSTYGSYDRTRSTDSRSRSTTSRTMQPGQPEMAEAAPVMSLPTAEGGSEKEITADQPQISVLEATNSLLVFATPRQHDAISLVIAHADRTPESTTTPYVVYALENQDPLELADVLTKLIQETVEEVSKTSTPESKIQTGAPTASTSMTAKVPTLEEQKIRIIPDEMSYSLIVYANKRNQQWVAELISELDEYRPQVLLDCTLVEIKKNESFEYDLDIITRTYGMNNGGDLKSGDTLVGKLASFTDGRYVDARAKTDADPLFKAFFNSENIQGLLTAIQTKGYGRVMAKPKILVNDNQEGEIKTETKTSIAQQSSKTIPGTGGSDPIITEDVAFSEYTSGVALKIKPHISKGDMLRLEITLNRKDFDFTEGRTVSVADATYPRPPDILSTDVTTVATVPDGTTIILGGLEGVDQQKATSKVPILGDIPLVGGLFRGVDDSGKQNKLYVFVKANILRPSDQIEGLEDIRRVSAKNREAFEEMEKKFQEHEDWPGVKPKPMHPEKVLEDDEYLQEIKKKLEEMDKEKATVGVE